MQAKIRDLNCEYQHKFAVKRQDNNQCQKLYSVKGQRYPLYVHVAVIYLIFCKEFIALCRIKFFKFENVPYIMVYVNQHSACNDEQ